MGSIVNASREVRAVALQDAAVRSESRAVTDDGLVFTGHAAVFNRRTWIGPKKWGWWEEVDSTAFRDVLNDPAAFLVNHDPNIILARNGATMRLSTDNVGLAAEADWDPADPDAVMWAGRVRRGDITKMSFAFTVAEERWAEDDAGDEIRTILTIDHLYDVALVTYPAYDGTDAAMRDSLAAVAKRHRGYDPRSQAAPVARAAGPTDLAARRHRLLAAKHRLPL